MSTQQNSDKEDDNARRRYVPLALAVLLMAIIFPFLILSSGGGAGLTLEGTDPWIHEGGDTEFSGSSVDAVTFGDPSEPLVVEWAGFDSDETEIVFNVTVRGLTGGDNAGTWSNGKEETESDVLAQGSYTVKGDDGTVELTWSDIFGESRPVTVSDHPEIERDDFEADGNGVRSRMLVVGVEATAPDENTAAEDSTMLGAVLGIEPLGYISKPPSDTKSTQMAVVIHNPSGGGEEEGSEDELTEPDPGPETQPEPDPPGGGGGGVITPVPVPDERTAGVSGIGDFEAVSEHEAVKDE